VASMAAASVTALVAIIMPAVANATAPSKSDTIQTWTCRWKGAVGAPESFEPLCRESVCCSFLTFVFPFALITFTDAIPSNSRHMLPFHFSSSMFYSWSRVFKMPLLCLRPSRHLMKSWSSLPNVSTLLLQAQTIVHESSKRGTDQRSWF
jgi:hypothetical protein